MSHKTIFDIVKMDFCHLFQFKIHGDTLEIITPMVTLTSKFVSVFITQRGEKLIVTDGGWIHQNIYDCDLDLEDKETVFLIFDQYKKYYNITQNKNKSNPMYFRAVTKIELLSAAVFDVANFIVGIVNSYTLDYRDKKDKEDRDKFRSETNDFLKMHYKDNFRANHPVFDVKYSGAIIINSKMHLFEYVTGSNSRYFENDLRRATINFQLIQEKPYVLSHVANRIAIFNDDSLGYQNGFKQILVNHLEKSTTHERLLRSKREEIFSIINPN